MEEKQTANSDKPFGIEYYSMNSIEFQNLIARNGKRVSKIKTISRN